MRDDHILANSSFTRENFAFLARAVHRLNVMIENSGDESIFLIKDRLKAQIFDSAPASITPGKLKSWRTSSPHACIWVNLAGMARDSVDRHFANLHSKDEPEVAYWNSIKYSKVCVHQAFIYSESDDLW